MTKKERKVKPPPEDDDKVKKSLIGESNHIRGIEKAISEASQNDCSVLIVGPTGTGKELIAQRIHFGSDRKDKPYIPLNCAGFTESLFESELFGIEKNVATGVGKRIGKIKEAEGGTLFLDEIGDMPMSLQPKLLRFLDSKSSGPIGGIEQTSNVRIISATNRDVRDQNIFREDLYYRLAGYSIPTLPLKDRPVDIICLVNHFAYKHKVNKQTILRLKPLFYSYSFPGNMRELETLLRQSDSANYIISEIEKNSPQEPMKPSQKRNQNNEITPEMERRINDHNRTWNEYRKDKKKFDAFFKAIYYIKHKNKVIDLKTIILCYEVLSLYQEGISLDIIAKDLHINRSSISKENIENELGFSLLDKHKSYRIETWTDALDIIKGKPRNETIDNACTHTSLELDETSIEILRIIAAIEDPFDKTGDHMVNEHFISDLLRISVQKTAHRLSQLRDAQYIRYDSFGNLHGITDSGRDFLEKPESVSSR